MVGRKDAINPNSRARVLPSKPTGGRMKTMVNLARESLRPRRKDIAARGRMPPRRTGT